MKKFFLVIMMAGLSLQNYAQDIQNMSDMLRFSLHHFMQNPPCAKYKFYLWKPGDRYFVSVDFPDSCQIQQIFPKKDFPDVKFYRSGETPAIMKPHVSKLSRNNRVPAVLHQIGYTYEENLCRVQITSYDIVQQNGEFLKYITEGRDYVFVYDVASQRWVLDEFVDYGP